MFQQEVNAVVHLKTNNMNEVTNFEENNPEQLKEFIKQFNILMDHYHANTYLIDGVWEGAKQINQAIREQLNQNK